MRRIAVIAASLALAIAAIPTLVGTTPAPGDARPAAGNLLINPGAEVGLCTTSGYDAMTVPGWVVQQGSPDSVCYGAIGFPRIDVPGPTAKGRAFFAGGATGDAMLTQRIPLAAGADQIDHGDATFELSGWLGGFGGQNDRVGATATFVDGDGQEIDGASLPPITNTARQKMTQLMNDQQQGSIPPGTRAVVITLRFTWTAGDTTDGYADDLSFTTNTPVAAARLTVPTSAVPDFDHVFFVFMENENATKNEAPVGTGDYIVGNPAAPYLNGVLTFNGARLAQMYATTHPSDPNYLAVTGGSTFGWTRNPIIGLDQISATNLGDQLDDAGLSWRGYAEGMHGNCDKAEHNTASGGYYLPDDEPFMMYADIVGDPARCADHNQPLSQLRIDLGSARTTPAFVWFAANDVNNMEDGGVRTGDSWLSRVLPEIFASPAWTSQRSLLIVSWDEGHKKAFGPGYPNHIPTYVAASQGLVKDDFVSTVRYSDYSLGATIEHALGVSPLTSNDAYAQPLNDIWTTTGSSGGAPPGGEASLTVP